MDNLLNNLSKVWRKNIHVLLINCAFGAEIF